MIEPNIYHAVVFNLHPKIKEFLDQLDMAGQIDHDQIDAPHLISSDPVGQSIFRCVFMRNNRPEHFVMHTRRKADPVRSWKEDGWVRPKPVEAPREDENGKRKERDRRAEGAVLPLGRACLSIMEQILPRRR